MTKSILFSVIAIGVAATVIGFAATQAAFTDSQTASGEVDAGTINLYLLEAADDDNAEDEFVFEPTEDLLPGNFTTDSLRLRNDGTGTFIITALDWSGSTGGDCDLGIGGEEFVPSITGVSVGQSIAPGAFVDATVRVDLSASAGNDCQGAAFQAVLDVDVSS
jgi:predicted ribosomally synthesized peptide with SipW-like signal peptide